jgi:predicted ATPase/class 3 adenylate cyclase
MIDGRLKPKAISSFDKKTTLCVSQGGGGRPLQSMSSTSAGLAPTETIGATAERRHLTVLFCDIVGSTALSTRLDPEDLRRILLAFQAACNDAIQRYDGHIARYMGDGILAYFGFPHAHEDDAERCVHAAIQMVESISALKLPGATPLEVRIGIATGLVVVGDLIGEGPSREFALIGEAPNLAAWLQHHAKPNQILVSPHTRRLLARLFEFDDLGEQMVKGHDAPVHIWSVLRPSTVRSRFEARQSSRLTPFVGRDLELAVLRAHYDDAKRSASQVVSISGEPGIGKSRLIMTFRQQLAGENCRALLFQCSSYHTNSPWYPVIRHLEDAMGVGYGAPAALRLERLEALVGEHLRSEREKVVPLLAALLSIPTGDRYPALELTPQQQKKRTFAALLGLVRAQSQQQPLIMIGEDVHWMDPTSWELFELLRQNFKDWRVLVLLSYRPDFRPPWIGRPPTVSISLNRVQPGQATAMIESLTDDEGLPAKVIEQIVAKTDGVPLFIEEVTKTVLADRATSSEQVTPELPWTPVIPDTLHDSLMARLDQAAPMKAVAQISSAIGREVPFDVLEAIAPLPQGDVREAVDQLVACGLLFRREGSAVETYAFNHALVQDAAYASMLRDARRDLHIRIADTLSSKFSDLAESAPEIVAHHYTQAREIKPAIDRWIKAGRQAAARSAFVEALSHFQIALKLLPELPESIERDQTELMLQQALASASIAARGFGAAETTLAFNRALQLCEKLGNPAQIVAVLNGLVGVHLMRGQFENAHSVAQDLLARAQRQNDATALLMGHRVLGMSLFTLGQLTAAKTELEKALTLYDPAHHKSLALVFAQDFKATAQIYLGLTLLILGDVDGGLAHGEEALRYAEELRHPHSICYVLPFLAGAYLLAGKPEQAHAVAERAIDLSAEYGFPQWHAGGLLLRGWARIELGRAEQAIVDIRDSISGLEATGTLVWMQFARFLLARALAGARRPVEALQLAEQIAGEIVGTSGRWYEAEVHRLRGDMVLKVGGAKRDAEACYHAALATAQRQGAVLWQTSAVTALDMLRRG